MHHDAVVARPKPGVVPRSGRTVSASAEATADKTTPWVGWEGQVAVIWRMASWKDKPRTWTKKSMALPARLRKGVNP